jgi:hypothetical protein
MCTITMFINKSLGEKMAKSTSNKPKRKKASGWDKWKAKKKAKTIASVAKKAGLASVPVSPNLASVSGATGIPIAPPQPTTVLKNHYALILDRSGSMGRIRNETISAFNEQIKTVRLASRGQSTDISLFPFSSVPDQPTFFTAPVESLIELNYSTFVPSGSTALYDAIIAATDKLAALPDANDPNTSFLVTILTDGENNCSSATVEDVAQRVKTLQDTKRWTFTFVGANVDVGDVTKSFKLSAGNARSYSATPVGVSQMNSLHNFATNNFFSERSMGSTQSLNLYADAEKALAKQELADAMKKINLYPTT